MKLEVQVISTEVITPSSPTPNNLKTYQLSFLDQINPPVFMPLVLFYPHTTTLTKSEIQNHLKKSLSQALTLYYPLAGRLVNNNYINCNDEGVTYVESIANCNLIDVISDPIPSEFNKLLPCDLDDVKGRCLIIQLTFFNCNGLAIGIGLSHKLADAWSFFMFLNSWAKFSRGDAHIPQPKFISASLFPPKDVSGFSPRTGMVKKEEIITKRFVFTASKIASLRDKYTKEGKEKENIIRPTRIEALSTFIWTRFMVSTQEKDDPSKIYTLLHAVNLRTKADPPLSDYYFGNISRPAITVPSFRDDQDSGYGIIEKVREAIHSVGGDYVYKLQDGNEHLNFLKDRAKEVTKGEVVSFSFTSLCRFPLYEADFGWGKPVWVGSSSLGFKNLVTFLDSLSGGGIEVWVHMKWEDMQKFEADEELLAYVSSSGHEAKQFH